MLRLFLAICFTLSLIPNDSLFASPQVVPIGVVNGKDGVTIAVAPTSTLVVTLNVEVEEVTVGVYARYAQKLLGLRAPLVAKSSTKILSADIALAAEDHYIYRGECDSKEVESVVSPLPIDVLSSFILPIEDAAEVAAREIFRIRRTRREMISGDLGEGFFGGGLGAALERLDRDEQQYLELFMGRTTTTRECRTFEVALDSDATRYIICRYSPQLGVVDSSDLAAEPILLQITPSGDKPEESSAPSSRSSRKFRVADRSTCQLFYGTQVLGSSVIPLFEYGYDVSILIK